MRQIYSLVILLISAMMMFFYRFVEKNERTAVTKSIKKLFLSAILTSFLYAAAIVINSETGAVACYGYYFAASDFLILSLLCFIEKYADIKRKSGAAERILYAGAIADTLSMTVNIFNHNVFACEAVETQSGTVFYHIYSIGVLYIIHRIFIILLIALAISILLYKFVNAPVIHKKKYLVILILFSVAVALDIVSLVLQLPVDLSLAAYGAVAFGIYYFAVIYIPHDLVEQLLANAVRSMDDGVMCYDGNGRCVYINDIILKSIQNRNIQEIKDTFLAEYTAENPDRNEEMSVKKVLLNENDEKRFLDISYKALLDQNGEYLGCFFVFHDETEEILKFKRERYRITHDKLTDLYNREHFYEKVKELLEYAANDEYYMICCDIKDFKLVNDVFGMKKGDELLINIANRLRKLENGLDRAVYGRMSGDRFAVCISKRRYNEELFIREVQKLGEVSENKSYHVYIHMGVFPVSDTSLEVSVMCDRAFMAINSIKDSYTEVVAYYDEKLRESRIHEKQITSQFNDAIRNGQFKMFLQPQIDTKGELKGAEALVRWYHPEQGVIPPLEFIGIFEKSGLIGTLDHHIWELACQQLKKWKAEGKGEYHISVNISPKDFYFMNIYDIFTGLVEKYDIDPVKLKLEITETAIMSDAKNQLALIDRLREYGFEVEIDDFGSGYSSLSMLKEMNVDVLKVDMGFLEKTDNLEKSRAILGTIIDLAKHLGMEVVTEGVETEDQVNFLREAGCDIFQGYYFDRPMQVDDFENKYFSK